ncbi:MAG: hypothetical protein LUQ50_13915 [Methanospirillum sp.]|uniref:hypothetical protein n=1 Tax=Methanospirillum sp. TaxID=45200 RepID=UPI00236ABF17|nr:hypothetical protein [Methanospirillum sp.]MDD1730151.1 hypothetical protein [Methanospirillum sp.]
MNHYLGSIFGVLLILLLISSVSAHPPSDLNLAYNQTTGNLSATFTHTVTDMTTHYLKNVKIIVDGNETINQDYMTQPTPDIFAYTYSLNASPGTVIDVSGQCSIGGTIKRSLTV